MSGATGHRAGIPLRRPALRNIRSVGAEDTEQNRNLDAISDAVGDVPVFPFSEIKKIVITFTAGTLDQTLAHGLGSKHAGIVSSLPSAPATIYSPPLSSDSKILNSHFRIVASAACTATVWVWR